MSKCQCIMRVRKYVDQILNTYYPNVDQSFSKLFRQHYSHTHIDIIKNMYKMLNKIVYKKCTKIPKNEKNERYRYTDTTIFNMGIFVFKGGYGEIFSDSL